MSTASSQSACFSSHRLFPLVFVFALFFMPSIAYCETNRGQTALTAAQAAAVWRKHCQEQQEKFEESRKKSLTAAAAAKKAGNKEEEAFQLGWAKKYEELREEQKAMENSADAVANGNYLAARAAGGGASTKPELVIVDEITDPKKAGFVTAPLDHNGAVANHATEAQAAGVPSEHYITGVDTMEEIKAAGKKLEALGITDLRFVGHAFPGKFYLGKLEVNAQNATEVGAAFPSAKDVYVGGCKYGCGMEGTVVLDAMAKGMKEGSSVTSSTGTQWSGGDRIGQKVEVGSTTKVAVQTGERVIIAESQVVSGKPPANVNEIVTKVMERHGPITPAPTTSERLTAPGRGAPDRSPPVRDPEVLTYNPPSQLTAADATMPKGNDPSNSSNPLIATSSITSRLASGAASMAPPPSGLSRGIPSAVPGSGSGGTPPGGSSPASDSLASISPATSPTRSSPARSSPTRGLPTASPPSSSPASSSLASSSPANRSPASSSPASSSPASSSPASSSPASSSPASSSPASSSPASSSPASSSPGGGSSGGGSSEGDSPPAVPPAPPAAPPAKSKSKSEGSSTKSSEDAKDAEKKTSSTKPLVAVTKPNEKPQLPTLPTLSPVPPPDFSVSRAKPKPRVAATSNVLDQLRTPKQSTIVSEKPSGVSPTKTKKPAISGLATALVKGDSSKKSVRSSR